MAAVGVRTRATAAATARTVRRIMARSPESATLVLGKQGRLVIPAEVRAALGLAPGDRLHLHLAGQQLMLERPQDAAAELRDLGASIPRARSLVDELLAERRLAAAAQ